jgi:hypothetical protein
MSEFNVVVNGVDVMVIENGFEEDMFCVGPGISITAESKGSKKGCSWWYSEEDKGVYRFDDCAYDSSDGGHDAFFNWLQKTTGCDEEEALDAMEQILESVDKSVKFADQDLYDTYKADSTEAYIESGININYNSGDIYQTEDGSFIGVVLNKGKIMTIIEMDEEEIEALETEIDGMQFDDGDRTELIIEAIENAAGIGDE